MTLYRGVALVAFLIVAVAVAVPGLQWGVCVLAGVLLGWAVFCHMTEE